MSSTRSLGKEVIQIKRALLVVDPRDNTPWRKWESATLTTVKGCMVEPFPLAEKLNFEENRDREFSRSAVRMYVPPDTDVIYTDRILWDSLEWQVLGHPGLWVDLNGRPHHKAIIAQIRQG